MQSTSTNSQEGTVAIGYQALKSLTSGAKNIAIGYNSMLLATTSTNNVAIGYDAMNAMVGDEADKNDGHHNIAIGTDAMGSVNAYTHTNSTSDGNIAIGTNALLGGVFADSALYLVGNIAIGYNALDNTGTEGAGTTGNVAIGYEALTTHDGSGSGNNTAIGYQSMKTAVAAQNNVMIGWKTGYRCANGGAFNTIVGSQAFSGNQAGLSDSDENTAVGYLALSGITVNADANTAVGVEAGKAITTGDFNTCIGHDSDAAATGDNQIAIGNGAITDAANRGRWGNSSVSQNNIQTDWTVDSDIRIKKDIESSDIGLSFVNALKTRKYKKKHPSEYDAELLEPRYKQGGINYDDDNDEIIKDEFDDDKVWNGLVAQEVKAVMDDLDVEFSGWSEDTKGKQGIQYATLVIPLIKAVQELSAKVEALENA